MDEGDAALLRAELEAAQAAMAALQRNFDDFQESSRELEDELEAELGRVRGIVAWLKETKNLGLLLILFAPPPLHQKLGLWRPSKFEFADDAAVRLPKHRRKTKCPS